MRGSLANGPTSCFQPGNTEQAVTQKPDTELVAAALRGDIDGFTELCGRYYPAMVALAHAVLADRHLTEDAAQEAFAKAANKLLSLKELHKFPSWLAAICRNVARDMARRRSKLRTIEDIDNIAEPQSDPETTYDHAEAVRDAIRTLPRTAREIVYLRYYDGMTYERMSAMLGLSKQAINGRLRRAKDSIARTLRRNDAIEVKR